MKAFRPPWMPTAAERRREADTLREPSHRRGYGNRWRKFRRLVLAAEPLCRRCEAEGRGPVAATDLDHIVPVTGPADPSFFLRTAVQPLCHSCHSRKTAAVDMRRPGGKISSGEG